VALFAYYRDNLIALNKYVLNIIKLDTHPIYILQIKQEGGICKEYIKLDIIKLGANLNNTK
jgi:hypothetical protein